MSTLKFDVYCQKRQKLSKTAIFIFADSAINWKNLSKRARIVVSALNSRLTTVNCSNLGQPDITWDAKKATILQNFQGPYFILLKVT